MDKERMIQQTADVLQKLYFEDVEFFWGLVAQFAAKKGIK